MDSTRRSTGEQSALWNGTAGRAWVESQELLDQVLQPLEDRLLGAAFAGPASSVLDVGCGAGSTSIAVARRLGPGGTCSGIDVSAPLIAAARARAERERVHVEWILADAGTHPFEAARFDTIVSRFGVMFFEDPVQAFANLRRAAKDGARLRFVAWRSASENPFMTAAERAAGPLLPELSPRGPDGPGQFAFADGERVRRILEEAGWSEVDVRPVDVPCTMPEAALTPYVTRMGPVGRLLQQVDERRRARIVEVIRAALEPYVEGPAVRFSSACWMVGARGLGTRHSPEG